MVPEQAVQAAGLIAGMAGAADGDAAVTALDRSGDGAALDALKAAIAPFPLGDASKDQGEEEDAINPLRLTGAVDAMSVPDALTLGPVGPLIQEAAANTLLGFTKDLYAYDPHLARRLYFLCESAAGSRYGTTLPACDVFFRGAAEGAPHLMVLSPYNPVGAAAAPIVPQAELAQPCYMPRHNSKMVWSKDASGRRTRKPAALSSTYDHTSNSVADALGIAFRTPFPRSLASSIIAATDWSRIGEADSNLLAIALTPYSDEGASRASIKSRSLLGYYAVETFHGLSESSRSCDRFDFAREPAPATAPAPAQGQGAAVGAVASDRAKLIAAAALGDVHGNLRPAPGGCDSVEVLCFMGATTSQDERPVEPDRKKKSHSALLAESAKAGTAPAPRQIALPGMPPVRRRAVELYVPEEFAGYYHGLPAGWGELPGLVTIHIHPPPVASPQLGHITTVSRGGAAGGPVSAAEAAVLSPYIEKCLIASIIIRRKTCTTKAQPASAPLTPAISSAHAPAEQDAEWYVAIGDVPKAFGVNSNRGVANRQRDLRNAMVAHSLARDGVNLDLSSAESRALYDAICADSCCAECAVRAEHIETGIGGVRACVETARRDAAAVLTAAGRAVPDHWTALDVAAASLIGPPRPLCPLDASRVLASLAAPGPGHSALSEVASLHSLAIQLLWLTCASLEVLLTALKIKTQSDLYVAASNSTAEVTTTSVGTFFTLGKPKPTAPGPWTRMPAPPSLISDPAPDDGHLQHLGVAGVFTALFREVGLERSALSGLSRYAAVMGALDLVAARGPRAQCQQASNMTPHRSIGSVESHFKPVTFPWKVLGPGMDKPTPVDFQDFELRKPYFVVPVMALLIDAMRRLGHGFTQVELLAISLAAQTGGLDPTKAPYPRLVTDLAVLTRAVGLGAEKLSGDALVSSVLAQALATGSAVLQADQVATAFVRLIEKAGSFVVSAIPLPKGAEPAVAVAALPLLDPGILASLRNPLNETWPVRYRPLNGAAEIIATLVSVITCTSPAGVLRSMPRPDANVSPPPYPAVKSPATPVYPKRGAAAMVARFLRAGRTSIADASHYTSSNGCPLTYLYVYCRARDGWLVLLEFALAAILELYAGIGLSDDEAARLKAGTLSIPVQVTVHRIAAGVFPSEEPPGAPAGAQLPIRRVEIDMFISRPVPGSTNFCLSVPLGAAAAPAPVVGAPPGSEALATVALTSLLESCGISAAYMTAVHHFGTDSRPKAHVVPEEPAPNPLSPASSSGAVSAAPEPAPTPAPAEAPPVQVSPPATMSDSGPLTHALRKTTNVCYDAVLATVSAIARVASVEEVGSAVKRMRLFRAKGASDQEPLVPEVITARGPRPDALSLAHAVLSLRAAAGAHGIIFVRSFLCGEDSASDAVLSAMGDKLRDLLMESSGYVEQADWARMLQAVTEKKRKSARSQKTASEVLALTDTPAVANPEGDDAAPAGTAASKNARAGSAVPLVALAGSAKPALVCELAAAPAVARAAMQLRTAASLLASAGAAAPQLPSTPQQQRKSEGRVSGLMQQGGSKAPPSHAAASACATPRRQIASPPAAAAAPVDIPALIGSVASHAAGSAMTGLIKVMSLFKPGRALSTSTAGHDAAEALVTKAAASPLTPARAALQASRLANVMREPKIKATPLSVRKAALAVGAFSMNATAGEPRAALLELPAELVVQQHMALATGVAASEHAAVAAPIQHMQGYAGAGQPQTGDPPGAPQPALVFSFYRIAPVSTHAEEPLTTHAILELCRAGTCALGPRCEAYRESAKAARLQCIVANVGGTRFPTDAELDILCEPFLRPLKPLSIDAAVRGIASPALDSLMRSARTLSGRLSYRIRAGVAARAELFNNVALWRPDPVSERGEAADLLGSLTDHLPRPYRSADARPEMAESLLAMRNAARKAVGSLGAGALFPQIGSLSGCDVAGLVCLRVGICAAYLQESLVPTADLSDRESFSLVCVLAAYLRPSKARSGRPAMLAATQYTVQSAVRLALGVGLKSDSVTSCMSDSKFEKDHHTKALLKTLVIDALNDLYQTVEMFVSDADRAAFLAETLPGHFADFLNVLRLL